MIYIAGTWTEESEKLILIATIKKLRGLGYEVYAPMEHYVPNAWDLSNEDWGKEVFKMDIEAINKAEEVWVINGGRYASTGTAWECGYAYGIGKKVVQLLYSHKNSNIYSIMMINGCTEIKSLSNFLFNENKELEIEVK